MNAAIFKFILIQDKQRVSHKIVAAGMSQAICTGISMIQTTSKAFRFTCKFDRRLS